MGGVIGKSSPDRALSPEDVKEICATAVTDLPVDGKRVLVLIPDRTRHAPVDMFFHILTDLLCRRTRQTGIAGAQSPGSMARRTQRRHASWRCWIV